MKRQLQLFGDRTKAAKFIRFADRKMGEMKNQMRLQRLKMLNKLFRFGNNIEVYIESYHGFDKIRIRAVKSEDCRDFSGTPTEISADGVVVFSQDDSDNIITTNKWHLWDFGDGAFFQKEWINTYTQVHTYPTVGLYTVNRSLSVSPIWGNINGSALTNLRRVRKESGLQNNEADAWTDYLTAPWVTTSATFPVAAHRFVDIVSPAAFIYRSDKILFDLDLTTFDDTKKIFLALTPLLPSSNFIKSSGVESTLGGSINAVDMTTTISQYYNLIELTQYAGQLLSDVEIGDNSGFPRFLGATVTTGWRIAGSGANAVNGALIYRKHGVFCTKTKANYITVT